MSKAQRAVIIVLALLFAMAGDSWAQSQPKPQPQSKSSPLGEQQRPAQPTPSANFPTPQQITQSITDGIDAAAKQYEAGHPTPPPDNSGWWFNFFLVAFTGGLVVVGAGQCYLIFGTLRATEQAANAAVKGTQTAEKALATVERAFVFIDGFNTELATALDGDQSQGFHWLQPFYQQEPGLWITRFAAQPRWKNSGSTPTNQLTIQTDWRTFSDGVPADFDFSYRENPTGFFLAPQATELSPYLEIASAQQIVAWENNRTGVEPIILIWGRADYLDVFDAPHFVEWCYKLRLSRPRRNERMAAQFIQWGQYNCTDNPQENS